MTTINQRALQILMSDTSSCQISAKTNNPAETKIMIMAAFVGVWGIACLISGLASTGSFHEIVQSIITAFTGM